MSGYAYQRRMVGQRTYVVRTLCMLCISTILSRNCTGTYVGKLSQKFERNFRTLKSSRGANYSRSDFSLDKAHNLHLSTCQINRSRVILKGCSGETKELGTLSGANHRGATLLGEQFFNLRYSPQRFKYPNYNNSPQGFEFTKGNTTQDGSILKKLHKPSHYYITTFIIYK